MKLQAQWIVGFVDGEGCFHVSVNKHKSMKFGVQVLPEFVVVQHERDRQILEAFKATFKCGYIKKNREQRLCWYNLVRNTQHLLNIIIPFFEKHSLKTKKHIDFIKVTRRKILLKMQEKKHLEKEGFAEQRI